MPRAAARPDPPSEMEAYEKWRRREQLQHILNYVLAGLLLVALALGVYFAMNSDILNDFQTKAQNAIGWGTDRTLR